mgnify:CR=1 FL=1
MYFFILFLLTWVCNFIIQFTNVFTLLFCAFNIQVTTCFYAYLYALLHYSIIIKKLLPYSSFFEL